MWSHEGQNRVHFRASDGVSGHYGPMGGSIVEFMRACYSSRCCRTLWGHGGGVGGGGGGGIELMLHDTFLGFGAKALSFRSYLEISL